MLLQVEYVPIDSISPYAGNAKEHPAEQVEQIKESIKQFGMNDPVGVWRDEVVEGHGRLMALKELGYDKVPIIRLDDMTDEQRRAYMLVHNKLTMNSDFDMELLDIELDDIVDIDMTTFGFDDIHLDDVDDEPMQTVEDDEPETTKSVAMLGDIWMMGGHRVICGDSTDAQIIDRLMDGEHADMLFTSPPYSDIREYNGDKDLSVENIVGFIEACRPHVDYQCVNLGIQFRCGAVNQYWDEYIAKANEVGYKLMAWNVWDKLITGSIGQQKAFFPTRHEFIFVFGTEYFDLNKTWEKKEESITDKEVRRKVRMPDGGFIVTSKGDQSGRYKKMESVISTLSEHGAIRSEHPATFPVQLPAEYIKAMTAEGGAVIDPFGGSGTTLIACDQLKRRCYMCELDEHYVDVIIQRYINWTGETDDIQVLRNGKTLDYSDIAKE